MRERIGLQQLLQQAHRTHERAESAAQSFLHRLLRAALQAGPATARASKTTLPLASTVRTALKPAASKQARSSGIFAFMGLTPRRKAT